MHTSEESLFRQHSCVNQLMALFKQMKVCKYSTTSAFQALLLLHYVLQLREFLRELIDLKKEQYFIVCKYHILIHSSAKGHLGCFHILAIVNRAATNFGMPVSFGIMVFSWVYAQYKCSQHGGNFSYGQSCSSRGRTPTT